MWKLARWARKRGEKSVMTTSTLRTPGPERPSQSQKARQDYSKKPSSRHHQRQTSKTSFPRYLLPRRSQAEAGYVVVRHYLLARPYRMKGMPRADLHSCIHRRSIAVMIVIVRHREAGSKLSLCWYLSQCDAL